MGLILNPNKIFTIFHSVANSKSRSVLLGHDKMTLSLANIRQNRHVQCVFYLPYKIFLRALSNRKLPKMFDGKKLPMTQKKASRADLIKKAWRGVLKIEAAGR